MDAGREEGHLRARFRQYLSDSHMRIMLLKMIAEACVKDLNELNAKYQSIRPDAVIFRKETGYPKLLTLNIDLQILEKRMGTARIYASNMNEGLRGIANHMTALYHSQENTPMGLEAAAEGFEKALRGLERMRDEMLRRKEKETKHLLGWYF